LQRELGDRIGARRHVLGLTQAELAFRSDIHYSYIGSLETGGRNPSIDLIARLAKALEMDLGALLEGLQDLPGKKRPARKTRSSGDKRTSPH
jgi:transcriptional regulator with XRE-family HTH domain